MEVKTKVVMLGSGTPNTDPDRSGPAVAVIVGDNVYLVDFGSGVVRKTVAAYRNGVSQLRASNLQRAFLTHLHSDHTTGYPDLILTPWILGRSEPLHVYGPEGTKKLTNKILEAYEDDIVGRVNGFTKADPSGVAVVANEIEEGMIYQDELVEVHAIRVEHGELKDAFAFKFIAPDKTVVISGDTNPCEALIEFAKGCDILLHEMYYGRGGVNLKPEWREYHASMHTSSLELGIIAQRINPKLLVTYHHVYLMGRNAADNCDVDAVMKQRDLEMLEDIKLHFDGRVILGEDDQIYE